MKNLKLLALSFRTIVKNSKSKFLLIALAFVVAMPVSFSLISDSIWFNYLDYKNSVYGDFSHILYTSNQTQSNEYQQQVESYLLPQKKGSAIIKVLKEREQDALPLVCGVINQSFQDLAVIRLKNGTLLCGDGECALSLAAQSEYFPDSEIGSLIDISDRKLKLVGIFEDVGGAWPRSTEIFAQSIQAPNIMMSQNDFNAFAKLAGQTSNIDLFLAHESLIYHEIPQELQAPIGSTFLKNENRIRNLNIYTARSIVYLLVSSLMLLLAFALIFSHAQSDVDLLYKLFVLGFSKLLRRKFLVYRISLIVFGAIAFGLIEAGLISFVSLIALQKKVGMNLIINISESVISTILIVSLVLVFFGLLYGFTVFARSSYLSGNKENGNRATALKANKKHVRFPKAYWKIQIKKSIRPVILIGFVLIGATTLAIFAQMNYEGFIHTTEGIYDRYESQLDRQFDFAFSVIPRNPEAYEGEGLTYYHAMTYEQDGADADFIELLQGLPGNNRIDAFSENGNTFIVPEKAPEAGGYLDLSDGFSDGYYNQSRLVGGIELNRPTAVIPCNVISYPNHVLESLALNMPEGKLDLNKISAGEEVLLMTYPFEQIPLSDDGFNVMNRIYDYPKEGAIDDTDFKINQNVIIEEFRPKENFYSNSIINKETFDDSFEVSRVETHIGGIVRGRKAWFDFFGMRDTPYTILTNDEGMKALNLFTTYTRVRIYLDKAADDIDENLIKQITEFSHMQPKMAFTNQVLELTAYRAMNMSSVIFARVLILVSILSICFTVISQSLNDIRSRLGFYRLLRLNGASGLRLLVPSTVILVIVSAFGVLVSVALSSYFSNLAMINLFSTDKKTLVGNMSLFLFSVIIFAVLISFVINYRKIKGAVYEKN